ncbi:hypothetical protein KIM372_06280 [Bombiscardovia nodaiensis]|uniref:FHA domain-containing protein n=1 Tax=Bombiscardovia nodaiensis TaxID=2932181 RepID=A0ABN6S968_9BIFI|nr:hypothetical protein KIM372_06280 [Bombiscardovia nodaiensis]
MKEKTLRDRHTGATTLMLRTKRGELLNYTQAEWLLGQSSHSLLPFKYEPKGKGAIFYYDTTGLPSLADYLRMSISGVQYASLLRSLAQLGDLSAREQLPLESIRFELDHVFVEDDSLRFVCVPLQPLPAQQTSILGLLALLSESKRVKFTLLGDAALLEAVSDFSRRTALFSAFDFDEFLTATLPSQAAQSSRSQDPLQPEGSLSPAAVFDPFGPPAKATSAQQAVPAEPVLEQTDSSTVRTNRTNDAASSSAPPQDHAQNEAKATPAQEAGPAAEGGLPAGGGGQEGSPAKGGTRMLSGALPSGGLSAEREPDGQAATPPFSLVQVSTGQRLCQATQAVTLGRSEACEAQVVGNTNVSRMHAVVRRLPAGGFSVVDLGSANGTTVRGQILSKGQSAQLAAGESFLVADELIRIDE